MQSGLRPLGGSSPPLHGLSPSQEVGQNPPLGNGLSPGSSPPMETDLSSVVGGGSSPPMNNGSSPSVGDGSSPPTLSWQIVPTENLGARGSYLNQPAQTQISQGFTFSANLGARDPYVSSSAQPQELDTAQSPADLGARVPYLSTPAQPQIFAGDSESENWRAQFGSSGSTCESPDPTQMSFTERSDREASLPQGASSLPGENPRHYYVPSRSNSSCSSENGSSPPVNLPGCLISLQRHEGEVSRGQVDGGYFPSPPALSLPPPSYCYDPYPEQTVQSQPAPNVSQTFSQFVAICSAPGVQVDSEENPPESSAQGQLVLQASFAQVSHGNPPEAVGSGGYKLKVPTWDGAST
jgi:hypothetical protein